MQAEKQETSPIFNKKIAAFFIKLFLLFSLWFVCYAIFLRPKRVIDRPVTNFLTLSSVKLINALSPSTPPLTWAEESTGEGHNQLIQNGKKVLGVWDICNGIDLMFIYIGIIILLPYASKRKLVFIVCGIVAIMLANVIRISALYFISVYQRSAFDFSHHYLFTILMYILIFYGWLLFVKKGKTYEKSS